MFYERQDSLMLDSNMSFISDGVYDEMCATNPLKEEHWEKMQNLLPTPPCSPEDFCYQAFPELPAPVNLQEGLQVVPMKKVVHDNLVEIEPLPVLDLSDEEMQKLTSPTVFDDSIWLQSLSNPPPASTLPTRDQFESKNASDAVNYISHGIRTVHISDSVIGTSSPGFTQSYILTVNANPIQPLNTVGHLTTREVFMSQNATTWSLNSDPNFMNERAMRVGSFDATTQAAMPESPTKKGRRRLSRNSQEAAQDVVVATEENAADSEDSETTRATHNVLERKRREELKEKFQRLRDCLPELQDNDRAPKVLILKKSYEYVRFLEQEEQRLLADKELERQRRIILLNRRQLLLSM